MGDRESMELSVETAPQPLGAGLRSAIAGSNEEWIFQVKYTIPQRIEPEISKGSTVPYSGVKSLYHA